MTINPPLNRKLRMALIGGGGSAFIGRVHATAATLDHRAELVAGALSSDPQRSREAAPSFGIPADRAYDSYHALIAAEAARSAEERIDFVSIATPNHTHHPIARAALEAGFDVVCDKPMTLTLDEALDLAELSRRCGAVLCVTHNYSGYPLIRQARDMIRQGKLGRVLGVRVHYLQGWLWGVRSGQQPPRGSWKSDPRLAGSGSLGDIGTHCFHLASFVTGLRPRRLSAVLKTWTPARELEDYGHILLEYQQDATGMITISQATHGRLNDLTLEVDGELGALAWRQEEPNLLTFRQFGQPVQVYERNPNAPDISSLVRGSSRLPGGHPEGFFEAFANVYRAAFDGMIRRRTGQPAEDDGCVYPTVEDGVDGVRFIERSLHSSRCDGSWTSWQE